MLNIPVWLLSKISPRTFTVPEPTIVGTSGGRTSAMLSALMDYFNPSAKELVFSFQNTGLEHEATYDFLNNLGKSYKTPLVWLEFVKPLIIGGRPCEADVAVVDFTSANRIGKPFIDALETLAEFRKKVKNAPPVAPNPTMRLCTAYIKVKTQAKYVETHLGWDCYTTMVGLRADEPSRVARISAKDTRWVTTRAPLAEAGITKDDVMRFWREQQFDLCCPENLGNCTLCFLKDESDLAWNMLNELPSEHTNIWLSMQDRFGEFRKRGTATYRDILKDAHERFAIRSALASNRFLRAEDYPSLSLKRFKSLVRQETRVLRSGLVREPCMCEQAPQMTDDYIASIEV